MGQLPRSLLSLVLLFAREKTTSTIWTYHPLIIISLLYLSAPTNNISGSNMTTALRQFEFIMSLVIEWANDVPFATWLRMLFMSQCIAWYPPSSYKIIPRNGKPYLYDSLCGKRPGKRLSEVSSWTTTTTLERDQAELTDYRTGTISETSSLDEID